MLLGSVELDRVAGVMVGMAAGDALGAGYEFGAPAPPVPEMIGGGLGHWERGEWTDDTQMAVCIAKAAATGTLDPSAVAENFLAWFQASRRTSGSRPGRCWAQPRARPTATVAAAYFADHPHSSAGNGSLMRTASTVSVTVSGCSRPSGAASGRPRSVRRKRCPRPASTRTATWSWPCRPPSGRRPNPDPG